MTLDIFATVIVPQAALVELQKASQLLGIETDGMFATGLSPTGAEPATHFISSGLVYPRYVNAIKNGDMLFDFVTEKAAEGGKAVPYTRTQVKTALGKCDVSQDEPFVAMKRLGLQIIAGEI